MRRRSRTPVSQDSLARRKQKLFVCRFYIRVRAPFNVDSKSTARNRSTHWTHVERRTPGDVPRNRRSANRTLRGDCSVLRFTGHVIVCIAHLSHSSSRTTAWLDYGEMAAELFSRLVKFLVVKLYRNQLPKFLDALLNLFHRHGYKR